MREMNYQTDYIDLKGFFRPENNLNSVDRAPFAILKIQISCKFLLTTLIMKNDHIDL